MKTGRHSCRSDAEYADASITPVDVHCLPLLTSLPPVKPAYPPYWLLLPGLIHRTRPVIPLSADVSLFTPSFKAQGKYRQIQHNLLCHCGQKNVSRWCCLVPGPPAKKKKTVRSWRHVAGTHHVTVDLIGQNWNAVFGGHWGENKWNVLRFSQVVWLIPSQQKYFFSRTFQNFLQVLLGEDGATRVGWVGDDQAGSPLVNQTLQMLEVDLPRFLRLQEQTCTSADGESFEGDCLGITWLGHHPDTFTLEIDSY